MYGKFLIYWKLKVDTCRAPEIKRSLIRGGEREGIFHLSPMVGSWSSQAITMLLLSYEIRLMYKV